MGGRQRKIEMRWRCAACGHENLGRHKVCVTCGDPKDASEKFEMPGSTAAAPSVTDPELLRKANAGRDWLCAACGSTQSALNEACTQCGHAGGTPAATGHAGGTPGATGWAGGALGWTSGITVGGALFAIGSTAFVVVALMGAAAWWAGRPYDVPVTVRSVAWEHVVNVERYAVVGEEGFAPVPHDAMDVRSQGDRHHHDEQVLDHYETEYYTEQVQDGFTQESYTEQVACGEDCYETPQSCYETCTDDGNGFATCTETCTGGGQSCTTRYCTETRYRDVPRYRTEQRSREVPVYRAEPRYAEYFAWNAWRWRWNRRDVARGDTTTTSWPDVQLNVGLAAGEQERSSQSGTYEVVFGSEDGQSWSWTPADLATFERYSLGSPHVLRFDDGQMTVDPPPDVE